MDNYVISVDWLEACCYGNPIAADFYQGSLYKYRVVKLDRVTRNFSVVLGVYVGKLEFATIRQAPRSSALKKGLTLVKLNNRVLYSQAYISVLYDLFKVFNLKYKGLTRLDLCYDCNTFKGSRSPSKFVNNFVLRSPYKKGGVYRRGSDRFECHGSRGRSAGSRVTSIRFGSPNNKIGAYMYDKTLELEEVKDKPWIRKVWEDNGLISDEKTHVWRSEISISCQGQDLLNMSTGELFRLSPHYVEHYPNLVKIFHYYAAKVFDFRRNQGTEKKSNFERLVLFDDSISITCKPINVPKTADTGRMEKICYNKLAKLSQTYSDLSDGVRHSLSVAMRFLETLSGQKYAITQQKAISRYLDSFLSCRYLSELDAAYFQLLEENITKGSALRAEDLYNSMQWCWDEYASSAMEYDSYSYPTAANFV